MNTPPFNDNSGEGGCGGCIGILFAAAFVALCLVVGFVVVVGMFFDAMKGALS